MKIDLNKYIADVFRNGTHSQPPSDSKEGKPRVNSPASNITPERFVYASKYSLRLDEIV